MDVDNPVFVEEHDLPKGHFPRNSDCFREGNSLVNRVLWNLISEAKRTAWNRTASDIQYSLYPSHSFA